MSPLTVVQAFSGALAFPLALVAVVLMVTMASGRLPMRLGLAWLIVCLSLGLQAMGIGLLLFDTDGTRFTAPIGMAGLIVGFTLVAMVGDTPRRTPPTGNQ